jgi:hypothetical protein
MPWRSYDAPIGQAPAMGETAESRGNLTWMAVKLQPAESIGFVSLDALLRPVNIESSDRSTPHAAIWELRRTWR